MAATSKVGGRKEMKSKPFMESADSRWMAPGAKLRWKAMEVSRGEPRRFETEAEKWMGDGGPPPLPPPPETV